MRGTFIHHWWACGVVQPLCKTVWLYPVKLKISLFHILASSLPGNIPQRNACSSLPGYVKKNVHNSNVCNSPMSFNSRMNNCNAVYSQKGLLNSNED